MPADRRLGGPLPPPPPLPPKYSHVVALFVGILMGAFTMALAFATFGPPCHG